MDHSRRTWAFLTETSILVVCAIIFLGMQVNSMNPVFYWAFASLLLIPISKYIDSPWFTKPSDFIAIFLLIAAQLLNQAMSSSTDSWESKYYTALCLFALFMSIISLFNSILIRQSIGNFIYEVFLKDLR